MLVPFVEMDPGVTISASGDVLLCGQVSSLNPGGDTRSDPPRRIGFVLRKAEREPPSPDWMLL